MNAVSELRRIPMLVLVASLVGVQVLAGVFQLLLGATGISDGAATIVMMIVLYGGWGWLMFRYYRISQNSSVTHTLIIVGIVSGLNLFFTLMTSGELAYAFGAFAASALMLLLIAWIARGIAFKSTPQDKSPATSDGYTGGNEEPAAMAAATGEGLAALRQSTMKWLMGMSAATGVFLVSGVILAVKIDRTSEVALRHSDQVHYELAQWVITLVFMAVFGMYATYKYRRLKSQLVEATSLRIKTIRVELATAVDAGDTQKRIELESELRQLGA